MLCDVVWRWVESEVCHTNPYGYGADKFNEINWFWANRLYLSWIPMHIKQEWLLPTTRKDQNADTLNCHDLNNEHIY